MKKTELKRLETIIKTQLNIIKNRIEYIKNKEKVYVEKKVESFINIAEDLECVLDSEDDFDFSEEDIEDILDEL